MMPNRKWCSFSIESAITTQIRLQHLIRYIEGWAQTDLKKILDATAPSYRFTDPVVGSFDGRSLHKYFDLLQDRLCCTGAISRRQLTSAGSLDIAKWSFNCMAWPTEAVLDDSYKLPEVRKLP
jgi:hypothetical protein